ncbi:MAG: inner-rane translocator [Thermoleophilia bacterium]|nr:inner-rane translocator [Thermoleophilia bacterium]
MDELLQATFNGIAVGSIYAIAGVGLTLVYGILKLTNFAHGEFLTLGAYIAFTVMATWGGPLVLGIAAAALVVGVFGVITEQAIWRPLRRKRAGSLQLLLMSIGLSFVLRYLIQLFYSPEFRRLPVDIFSVHELGPIRASTIDLIVIGIAVGVIIVIALLLSRTLLGKSMRAISDNFDLAAVSGVDTRRTILVTWALGGALAGIGGVLAGMQLGIKPDMGFNLLLGIFAAVILGGMGNAYGALLGGYIIGIMQEVAVVGGLESRDKPAVGFAVLILVLLFRPQGILGRRAAVN